jgi:5-methylcytosine-specific restriction protein A
MLAPTPCRIPKCLNYAIATGGGVCQQHRPVWQESTRKARLPIDWNTRRLIVLKKADNICYLCGAKASEVDHVTAGDDHSLGNLAAICTQCHRGKSSLEGQQAKAANQPKPMRGYRPYRKS